MRCTWGLHDAGDVLTDGNGFGYVVSCVLHGDLCLLIDLFNIVDKVSTFGYRCNSAGRRVLWSTDAISPVMAWKNDGDDALVLARSCFVYRIAQANVYIHARTHDCLVLVYV